MTERKTLTRILSLALVLVTLLSTLIISASAASYSTGDYSVNTSSGLNVRSGAGSGYSKVGAATNGTKFTVSRTSGNWGYTSSIKCTNGTKSGWVCLDYCKKQVTAATASVIYQAHVAEKGWLNEVADGAVGGTTGECRSLEAIKVRLAGISGNVHVSVHSANIGWGSYVTGQIAGTTGRALAAEAFRCYLSGSAASQYDIEYRAHCADIGWTAWVRNGEIAGTTGHGRRMEAVQIRLVKKSEQSASGWQWPMFNYRVSQTFGHYSSSMKNSKGRPYHSGIDMVSSNTTVYAAASGTVVYKGYTSGNGNHVILSHTLNGTTVYTLYSHLSNYSSCPGVGGRISKGAAIGVMGNTGNSTGAHLHFAVFTGYSTDPLGYVATSGGNVLKNGNYKFYNPEYVINYGCLPA